MPTAVVTGITGQDGSFLAEQLLADGWRVVGLCRRSASPNHWRIAHLADTLELRSADLHDLGSLIETFPLATLGVADAQVFMPDDLETDARFERVLERRTPDALARSAALDAALRAIFDALRGPQRDALLAELDASTPSPLTALPRLLRGSFETWRRLPEPTRSRLAALARRVEADALQHLASAHGR